MHLRWILITALAVGCASPSPFDTPRPAQNVRIARAAEPSPDEAYCAWYGDPDEGVLYVGLAPFWSAMRATGNDPQADLATAGPQWIGRFDLARERWLEPIDVGSSESRSGVWDVHAHNNRVSFTTFYEGAGSVNLATGHVSSFAGNTQGLNEIAPGPGDTLVVSRYGSGHTRRGSGELVVFDRTLAVSQRLPLKGPPGLSAAPKTPAWDAARGVYWATSDAIASDGSASPRRDHYRISRDGAAQASATHPELQFVRFDQSGRGWLAEVDPSGALWLRTLEANDAPDTGRRQLIDPEFPVDHDFVQDIKLHAGHAILTRWSGVLHVVSPNLDVRSLQLPSLEPGGLYYSAVLHGDRVCSSYCGGVTVVCADAP